MSASNSINNNNNNQTKPYEFYGENNAANPWKVTILFRELGIEYNFHHVDIFKGDQFKDDFVKLFPNSKVPAIIDNTVEPRLPIFESGAIMTYLAQKHGQFLPDFKSDPHGYAEVLQWLTWQVAGLGPMQGQHTFFSFFSKDDVPFARERYLKETQRLYRVLDNNLANRKWVAGDSYSIADMAIWTWAIYVKYDHLPNKSTYPNVLRWLDQMNERPVIAKVLEEKKINDLTEYIEKNRGKKIADIFSKTEEN